MSVLTLESLAEAFAKKDAEIERLKEDHQLVRNSLDAADAKLLEYEKLITELCDALEWWENHTSYEPPFAVELKKRAREDTR